MYPFTASSQFIELYEKDDFEALKRASLLHFSVPMSFVMSAGLVQIESEIALKEVEKKGRYLILQECFRHFDVEKVGKTDVHLSLFEMPAAFMFDCRERQLAIEHLWEYATEELKLCSSKLWVTYFEGGEVFGTTFEEDTEAVDCWKKMGVEPGKIVGLGVESNLWVQKSNGGSHVEAKLCGLSTELYYDRGASSNNHDNCRPGCKCGRFIELSNILLVKKKIDSQKKSVEDVHRPFVEVVIGAERAQMLLERKDSVWDIDIFSSLLKKIDRLITIRDSSEEIQQIGRRVILDHIRALSILIHDGAPAPGRGGRCRIMRILFRRVMVYVELLGIDYKRLLGEVLPLLTITFTRSFVLGESLKKKILNYYELENKIFCRTVVKGKKHIDQFLEENKGRGINGSQVLYLEKKKGMPSLLSEKYLESKCLSFPGKDYRKALSNWKY